MVEMSLSKYGITGTTEIIHNPSYDLLFEEDVPSLILCEPQQNQKVMFNKEFDIMLLIKSISPFVK